MEFVNVIVDISHEKLDRIFQYRIPEELQGKISTGMQVQVPFGMGNRTIKGYVTGVTDVPDYPVEKIKPVTGLVDGAVPAESELIALAAWMKKFYGSTMNPGSENGTSGKTGSEQQTGKMYCACDSKRRGGAVIKGSAP